MNTSLLDAKLLKNLKATCIAAFVLGGSCLVPIILMLTVVSIAGIERMAFSQELYVQRNDIKFNSRFTSTCFFIDAWNFNFLHVCRVFAHAGDFSIGEK